MLEMLKVSELIFGLTVYKINTNALQFHFTILPFCSHKVGSLSYSELHWHEKCYRRQGYVAMVNGQISSLALNGATDQSEWSILCIIKVSS